MPLKWRVVGARVVERDMPLLDYKQGLGDDYDKKAMEKDACDCRALYVPAVGMCH